jgi:hypothetical protein
MSEQTQNSQQTLIIALIVIAVLLAAAVGVLIWRQSNQAIPQPSAGLPSQQSITGQPAAPQGMGSGTTAPQGMGGSQAAPVSPAEVDPKSATAVPEGTEPEAFVKSYYENCDKGDWEAAFAALPADKKAGNSPDALKEQVSGYGVKGYAITDASVQGDQATIKVDQETASYGTFENTWVFVKKDGSWFVASKAVTGMK